MSNNKLLGSGKCGAKMILIGEHAVVYKNAAIAMPFNGLETKVSIYETNNNEITIDSMYHKGLLDEGIDSIEGVIKLIYYILDYLNIDRRNLAFKIESNIIARRGLGSSAAVSVAIIRAIYNAFNKEISDKLLIEHATFAEKIHHSNPSGIDLNVLVYQKPIWFKRGVGIKPLNINFGGTMMIIDSGIPSQTRLAVEHVASLHASKNAMVTSNFKDLERLTFETLDVLKDNRINDLGVIMDQAQVALKNIEVSSQMLDTLILKVKKYGALGAKLTGGGVGGCIIALTKSYEEARVIKTKLKADNIENVWIAQLGELI